MVSSVSGYSPSSNVGSMDKVSYQQLQSAGLYSSPNDSYEQQPQQKSGGSVFGTIGKVLLTAAVVGGGAIAARKYIPSLHGIDAEKVLEKDAKLTDKIKTNFAKYTDWLEEHTIGYLKSKKEVPAGEEKSTPAPASAQA